MIRFRACTAIHQLSSCMCVGLPLTSNRQFYSRHQCSDSKGIAISPQFCNAVEAMFPAVVNARRRNIRTPERRVSDMKHRSPANGMLPHSLSPTKLASASDSESNVATVGSWMLRRGSPSTDHPQSAGQDIGHVFTEAAALDSKAQFRSINHAGTSLSQNRHRQGHYGFNATAHTNDRAVALACVASATPPLSPPLFIHIRACRYRIQSHPFLKKDKDARAPHTASPITKASPETLPRVHVQGQFGHSVNLDQSLVANRGDIVQKYSSVTKQRGFQDAGALQELHAEHRQRTLQLPFPNPAPPSMECSSFLGDASRKTALQTIQCVAAAFNMKRIFALTTFNQFSVADIPAFMSPFPRMKPLAIFFWTVCCLALQYQPTRSRHQRYSIQQTPAI
jgi:hypothetical protein